MDAATGVVRPFVAQADSTVHALDLRAGRLFVAGSFGRVGGVARLRLAAVNPTTGAVDAQFAPQPNNNVLAVRANPAGSVVYIAGDFTGVGPVGRGGLAALNGVTGAPIAPVFGNTYRPSLGLDMNEDGSRLFVAAGALGNQVQAYNPTTGVRLWRQRADGDVQAVAYHAGTVYFGFHESFEADTRLRMLAADATTGAIDPTFRPVFDLFWGVRAISATDAGLAAGGEFNWVSTVRAQGVVTWRGTGGGPGPQPPAVMLDANTSWRYLAGPSAAPAGWEQPGFADGAWPAGRPQLGYGDGDETTVVAVRPVGGRQVAYDVPAGQFQPGGPAGVRDAAAARRRRRGRLPERDGAVARQHAGGCGDVRDVRRHEPLRHRREPVPHVRGRPRPARGRHQHGRGRGPPGRGELLRPRLRRPPELTWPARRRGSPRGAGRQVLMASTRRRHGPARFHFSASASSRSASAGARRQRRVDARQRHVERDPHHRRRDGQVVAGGVELAAQARARSRRSGRRARRGSPSRLP